MKNKSEKLQKLDYLDIQKIKEFINSSLENFIRNLTDSKQSFIEFEYINNYKSFSLEDPLRNINFTNLKGDMYKIENEANLFLKEAFLKFYNKIGDSGFYTKYTKFDIDLEENESNYFETNWLSSLFKNKSNLNNQKEILSFTKKVTSFISDLQEQIIKNFEYDFSNIININSIQLIDLEIAAKEFSYLSTDELFSRLSNESNLIYYYNIPEIYYINGYFGNFKRTDNLNILGVLTSFNKYSKKNMILSYLKEIKPEKYNEPIPTMILEINNKLKLTYIFDFNIDSLTTLILNYSSIKKVKKF